MVRGVLTNLLNPPVVLFHMTVVPRFIGPQDPFLARALLLGTTHVAMSVVWQGSCGFAVGLAAEHVARPAVRTTLEGLTGAALVALGARLPLGPRSSPPAHGAGRPGRTAVERAPLLSAPSY